MSFTPIKRRLKKIPLLLQALVLAIAGLSPLILVQPVSAAQLTERKITMTTSKVNTAASYAVSFKVSATTEVEGIVVQFCQDSPIVGVSCDNTNGVSSTQDSPVTVNVTQNGSTVAYNVHASSDGAGLIKMSNSTGITPASISTQAMTFTLTGVNPTVNGTFYARILTYGTAATAEAYTATVPGTHIDDGGIALSTANQLTVTARVQEVLQFCVGTTLANAGTAQCSDMSGTSIDLGVVDSSNVSASANAAGKAMVRTNAVNGVSIVYFAEQNTSSGKLKVAGATCSGTTTTDQCFNSAGTSETTIVAGTELYGMAAHSMDTTNGTTTNITRDAAYDFGSTGYAWDDSGSPDILATSTTVVDDEMLNLKFAATASATTPTGAYTVTATFIATATF